MQRPKVTRIRMVLWLAIGVMVAWDVICCQGSIQLNDSRTDFFGYWSAGQLFVTGGNPYDPHAVLRMEMAFGYSRKTALVMWCPPWVYALLVPLLKLPL